MASRIGLKLSLRRNSRQKTDDSLQAERTSLDQRFAKTDQAPATQEVARVDATKRKEKAVILVMGPTGVGKSTFINLASNSDLRVSNSLVSCTDRIEVSNPFELDGKDVVLVDTPGFDDTSKSEADILNVVCEYLATEYKRGHLLHGILYLYRISDNRVSGVAARNLRFYRDLCGPEALPNSIIVTNFWGNVDPAEGVAREQELTTKPAFFKPALDAGARVWRHDGTAASAHRILRQLVHAAPRALRVQRELVDERRAVHATAAGETLLEDLARAAQKHAAEMAQLEEDLQDALREQDEEAQRELEEERARIAAEQAKLEGEKEKLMHLQVEALTRASSPVSGVQMQNFPATFAQAMSAQLASAPQATTMSASPPSTPPSAAAEQAQKRAQALAEQAQAKAAAERAQAQAQAEAKAKAEAEAQAKAKADAERARAEAETKAKEQAAREQEARERAVREQAAKEQAAREQAAREQAEAEARRQTLGRATAPTHAAAQAPTPAPSAPAPASAPAAPAEPAPEPPKPLPYDAENGAPQDVGPGAGCFGALARLISAIVPRLDELWARIAGLFLHPFYALLGYTRLE